MSTRVNNMQRFAALFAIVAGLSMPELAQADDAVPVLRTFGYLVLDGQEAVPDFLSEDSLAITALPDVTDPGAGTVLPLLVDGALTLWERHPVHYATKGGQKLSGEFYWLLDVDAPTPPPVGAHTFTGDRGWIDGFIQSVDVVKIRVCTSVNCGGPQNNGVYTIDHVNGTRTFVIVSAWFSR